MYKFKLTLTYLAFAVISLSLLHCKQAAPSKTEIASLAGESFKALPISTLDSLRENIKDYVLLDVRTPEEVAEGWIEGASFLDFYAEDFESKVDRLNKEKTYLIYCRSGNRSGQTMDLMKEKGFKHAINLDGGFTQWTELNNTN